MQFSDFSRANWCTGSPALPATAGLGRSFGGGAHIKCRSGVNNNLRLHDFGVPAWLVWIQWEKRQDITRGGRYIFIENTKRLRND